MPLFLILLGAMLISAAIHGNVAALATQIKDDGSPFIAWIFLIVAVGLAGYSKTIRPVSNAFLVLIVVAFILRNGKNIAAEFATITGAVGHQNAYWKS